MAVQNGKQISAVLQQLRQADEIWERYVFRQDGDIPGKIEMLLGWLMNLLRDEMKTETPDAVSEYLTAEDVESEAAAQLVSKVQNSLQFYFSFSVLRKLEEKDKTALQGLLTAVYERYIVRFERGYLHQIRPKECSKDEWNEIADRMDYLTDYYVSRSFTRKGIADDLLDETGLQKETCGYWADLIDRNYLLLKLNHITQELGKLRENDV